MKKSGMTLDQIDLVEINEAFASVVLAWQKELLHAARHDEHPWHAPLRVEALVAQAAALWQTARVAAPGQGGALATLPAR